MSQHPDVDTLGYIRVSSEQQVGEDKTSLAQQRRAIAERAHRLGRILASEMIFEDAGVSGATAHGRPAFMALIAYCEQHPRPKSSPGYVLALNDSRWGRFDSPRESGYWQYVLEQLGWRVRFAEGDDIEDGLARDVMRLVGASQASEYRANLVRTARRSARATAEQGRWQTRAPLGYRRLATGRDGTQRVLEDRQRKSADEVVRLTPGPESEQALVQFIFTEYASGRYSLGRLARVLHEQYPGRHWSNSTVQALLRNVTYMGDVVWCRRPHNAAERRETPVRDRSQWVTVHDAHPALVSRELFAQVEARLATNRKERRATSGGYPLSGFVSCAHCGEPFVGGGGRRGPDDDPDRYRFYADKGGIVRRAGQVQKCTGALATLRKRWIEERVVNEIARVTTDPRVQAIIAEELDLALETLHGGHSDRQRALEREIAELHQQRGRIVAAIGRGQVNDREAGATLAELRAKVSTLEAEVERTRFAARRTDGMHELRDRLLGLAADFETQAKRASGSQLRELVRPWIAGATLNKQNRVLTLRIRRVPDLLGTDTSYMPGRVGQEHTEDLVVTRRIRVPHSPLSRQTKRAAQRHA